MTPAGDSTAAELYFSLLLDRAREAGGRSNYAIAAALVVRESDREMIVIGENSVFGARDPAGHAEMNAIGAAQRLAGLPPAERQQRVADGVREGWLHFREHHNGTGDSVLYTTLEPCPMCTVCLLNAGIGRVVIAAEDPPNGTLEPSRLARLPSFWQAAAGQVDVSWCQSEDPADAATYLPPALRQALVDAFLSSRERLDEQLLAHGALDVDALREVVRMHFAPEMQR